MLNPTIPVKKTLSALRLSIFDGVFANIFGNLTGGIILPAYALALGASPFDMGLLSAIPLLSVFAQFGGVYLIERFKNTKRIVIASALIGRNLWIPLLFVSCIYVANDPGWVLISLIVMMVLYHSLGAITGVSWLSWMAGLVPDEIRGRYFGLRNSIMGATTILLTFLAGRYLDWFPTAFPDINSFHAYHFLFGIGIVAGVISVYFLAKKPEVVTSSAEKIRLVSLFRKPLSERNFAKLIRFGAFWSFAANLAGPFFIVYMLQDLKLSYTMVAVYTIVSSIADLIGMRTWGSISDHTGNKPVMAITGVFIALLPLAWLFTTNEAASVFVLIPVLHIFGGFFGSGYNLCTANLVFRLAPREGNAIFFGFWSGFNVVATGIAALLGGLAAELTSSIVQENLIIFDSGFKFVFIASFALRLISLIFLRGIREPQQLAIVKAIRVLFNWRFWTTAAGFHPLFFAFFSGEKKEPSDSPYWPIWQARRS